MQINLEEEFWNIRRKKLEKEFAKAALELMQHTGAGTMVLPIAGTTPQLFIAIGEATAICGMLLPVNSVTTAVEGALNAS